MVTPSFAVTIVVIVLAPTFKLIFPEAVPLLTIVPFTVTLAPDTATVGVTVIELVALLTDAV